MGYTDRRHSRSGDGWEHLHGVDGQTLAENCQKLMDASAMAAAWKNGRCSHPKSAVRVHRLCAALACCDCGELIVFSLRFGRPKMFDVYDNQKMPIGSASVPEVVKLVHHMADTVLTYKGDGPSTACPKLSASETAILAGVLLGDRRPTARQPVDLGAVWKDADCKHGPAACLIYGDTIKLACSDCSTLLSMVNSGYGEFDISAERPSHSPAPYGTHGADEVVCMIRKHAKALVLPTVMADRMSDDPESDARSIAETVSVLEKHGLLRLVAADADRPRGSMVLDLNAMAHTRTEFERLAVRMVESMRGKGLDMLDGGKYDSEWHLMESLRLEWPCAFEGVGIVITAYDPTGLDEYCVRCGHSTLDDADTGQDCWKSGCPRCGYDGYLLDMERWWGRMT